MKCERLVVAKDKNPRKQKSQQIDNSTLEESSTIKQAINIVSKSSLNIDSPKEKPLEEASLKEIKVLGNNEIFINYVRKERFWIKIKLS